jgi:amino acid permease
VCRRTPVPCAHIPVFVNPSLATRDFDDRMGTERLDDEAQLQALGHKGELERNFSLLSMLGLAFAILNSWTALSASIGLALPSGGSTSVIWGLVTAGICNLALAASLAEFLSAYPTAGGQYVHIPASRDVSNLITDTTGLQSSPQNVGYP